MTEFGSIEKWRRRRASIDAFPTPRVFSVFSNFNNLSCLNCRSGPLLAVSYGGIRSTLAALN